MLDSLHQQLGRYRNRFERLCYRSNKGHELLLGG